MHQTSSHELAGGSPRSERDRERASRFARRLRHQGSTFSAPKRTVFGPAGRLKVGAVAKVLSSCRSSSVESIESAGSSESDLQIDASPMGEQQIAAAVQAASSRDAYNGGSAEAIQALSFVGALVLGFSVTSLVAVACELNAELRDGVRTVRAFCVTEALATALSGYSTVFFTMEVYYLKRLSDEAPMARGVMIETFLTFTGRWRKLARFATNVALNLNLVSIALLLWEFLGGINSPYAWAVTSVLGAGVSAILLTMWHLQAITFFCLEEGGIILEGADNPSGHSDEPAKGSHIVDSNKRRRSTIRDTDFAVPLQGVRRRTLVSTAVAPRPVDATELTAARLRQS